MVFTGNVQVAEDHLTLGRDISIPSPSSASDSNVRARFVALARAMRGELSSANPAADGESRERLLAIMQVSHAGRQSFNVVGGRAPFASPLSASPVRLGAAHAGRDTWFSQLLHTAVCQQPREMTVDDIANVVTQFVNAARLAAETGFDGVELHAAHGCEDVSQSSTRLKC